VSIPNEGEAGLASASGRLRDVLVRPAIGLVAAAGLLYALRFGYHPADTVGIVQAADWILRGLRTGSWAHGGSHFPLLQTIPAVGLRAAGLGVDQTRQGLAILNVVAFAVLLGIAWRTLTRVGPSASLFFLAVLLSGPLLWYAISSFGEMLAALATLAMVAACWRRSGSLLAGLLLVVAGISKDTALPFLLLLGFGSSMLNPAWRESSFRARRLRTLAVAAAATLALIGIYNFARFGTVLNAVDSNPALMTPTLRDQVSFLGAIWLSPDGGLLVFWPSFGLLLGLVGVALARFSRTRTDLLTAGVAALALLGLSAGFAKWWSPLGWWAWGPRLLMPWLPAIGYLLVVAYGPRLQTLLRGLVQPAWRFWSCSLALAAVSLPQYVVLFRPSIFSSIFATDAVCPTVAYVDRSPGYYYYCINHQLWTNGSVLRLAYLPAGGRSSLVLGLACAAGLIWLLSLVRQELTTGGSHLLT
jgi:hypothetical protein